MNKQLVRYLQLLLLVLDLCTYNISVLISKEWLFIDLPPEFATTYFHFLIYSNVSWLLLSWVGALYSQTNISSFETLSRRTIHIYIIWLCSLMIYLFFYRQFLLSRFFLISSLLLFGMSLLLNRFIYLCLRNFYKSRDHFSKRVVILGYNDMTKKLISFLERSSINTKVIGLIENQENVKELTHYPVLNSIDMALEVSKNYQVHEIISTITPEQNGKIYEIMQLAEKECIRFKIIPDFSFFIRKQVHIEYLDDMPLLSLRNEPLEDIGNRIKKRVFDIVVSLLVILLLLSWLVPLISIIIKLDSKGPIFFKQKRSGKNNEAFTCLKFRSMKLNKHSDNKQAVKNDTRITKVGRILRSTSLDEFPQFFNVLKGDMSLVGPRPHMLRHTEDYSKLVDNYMVRHFLKPGITGWAQVNNFRGEVKSNSEIIGRVNCDIWYSENWSFWLDIRIVFLTIYNVVKGDKQAY